MIQNTVIVVIIDSMYGCPCYLVSGLRILQFGFFWGHVISMSGRICLRLSRIGFAFES